MSVTAKMSCRDIEGNDESGYTVKLYAVVGGSTENDRFFKFTPSGAVELYTVNPEAAKQFKVGKDYYVVFNEADEAE